MIEHTNAPVLSPAARAAAHQEQRMHHASATMMMAFLAGMALGGISLVALVVTWYMHY